MRLRLKLFAVILLLVIATFPNSSSITTLAEEAGNPCLEGCQRREISCRNDCGYNQSCVTKCGEDYRKCEASCKTAKPGLETPNEY